MSEENKVVYENQKYEVRAGESPFKFHRYSNDGTFIDKSNSYQIVNKETGLIEEETLMLPIAMRTAEQLNEELLNFGTLDKVGMNNVAGQIVQ